MERRDVIKSLTILPFAGSFLPLESVMAAHSGPLVPGPNIYQSIGVEPVINCVGTYTIIGGSIERPEVVQAMHDAAGFFVQYDELAFGIGRRIADLTGGNPEKLIRIPDLSGFEKTEVVIPGSSRNEYDHGVRNIGVKIVTVDSMDELEKALNQHTAMIYLMAGNETLPG